MTQKIVFKIVNEFSYNLDLIIEPFGVPFEIKPSETFKVVFTSTKKHDISNDVVVVNKEKVLEIRILGGWICFELFQDDILLIQLEI